MRNEEHQQEDQNIAVEKADAGEVNETAQHGEAEHVEEETRPDVSLPALLEALLLAHADPVSSERLMEVMRCSEDDFKAAVISLQEALSNEGRGLEVVQVASKYQLRTKPVCALYVQELLAVKPRKLSSASLETLAVIAYQQPIVRSEIEKIRGVDVTPTLKTLLERGIVKVLGYQASAGQPALYGTTEEFLKLFGINSLSDLPSLRDLRQIAREPGEIGEKVEDDGDQEAESAPISVVEEASTAVN